MDRPWFECAIRFAENVMLFTAYGIEKPFTSHDKISDYPIFSGFLIAMEDMGSYTTPDVIDASQLKQGWMHINLVNPKSQYINLYTAIDSYCQKWSYLIGENPDDTHFFKIKQELFNILGEADSVGLTVPDVFYKTYKETDDHWLVDLSSTAIKDFIEKGQPWRSVFRKRLIF